MPCDLVYQNLKKDSTETQPRVAHCRFLEDRPVLVRKEKYDKVVTIVWSYDIETNMLRYGATVYRREAPNDHWLKVQHRQYAELRYNLKPIVIKFLGVQEEYENMKNHAIDWCIARSLIKQFGAYQKEDKNTGGDFVVFPGFNEHYDPYYSTSYFSDDDTEDSDDIEDVEDALDCTKQDKDGSHFWFYFSWLQTAFLWYLISTR